MPNRFLDLKLWPSNRPQIMNREEVRKCLRIIRNRQEQIREALLCLQDRKAFLAMGCESNFEFCQKYLQDVVVVCDVDFSVGEELIQDYDQTYGF